MSTETTLNSPEARIGYNTLHLANSQSNSGTTGSGLGSASKGSTGYLDYFDYDTQSLNYGASNLYNTNNNYGLNSQSYGTTGLGYDSTYSNDNLSLRQLLRRRQGLMAGNAGQLGQLGQLSQLNQYGGGRQLNGGSGSTGQLNQLGSQLGNQLGQLGNQLGNQLSQVGNQFSQVGNQLGQMSGLGKADNLGLASSGYGHSGVGGQSGYGGYGGGGPVSIVSGYGPSQQCESGINPLLALLTLAGAAVGFYFIYIRLTMSGGRKLQESYFENTLDMMWLGTILKIQQFTRRLS